MLEIIRQDIFATGEDSWEPSLGAIGKNGWEPSQRAVHRSSRDGFEDYIPVFRRSFQSTPRYHIQGSYFIGIGMNRQYEISCYGTIGKIQNVAGNPEFQKFFNDFWSKKANAKSIEIAVNNDNYPFELTNSKEGLSWFNPDTNLPRNERPTVYAKLQDVSWENWTSDANAPQIRALAGCCATLIQWADEFIAQC